MEETGIEKDKRCFLHRLTFLQKTGVKTMDWQGKSIRIGTAGLAFAVLLSSAGAFTPVMDFLTSRSVAAVLLFMETGHVLREPQLTIQEETEAVHPTIDAPITEQIQPTQSVTVFAPDDAQLVEVNSVCG